MSVKDKDSFIYKLCRWSVNNIFSKYYRVKYYNKELVDKLKKPYMVLPNHCGFFDPFFINAPVREKWHYIVSDAQFRTPIMRYLLAQTGAIAITKNTMDLKSLKQMTDASRSGKVIGIFPEGRRNWDGATLPLIESTAKLVRMLNVPVVVPLIEGGYLMDPRWATSMRRGKVFITYKLLFDGEKPGRKKTSEIIEAMKEALDYNEFNSEQLKGIKFKSNKRAENIEQAIYICPECDSISSFHSKGNNFTCKSCGYAVHYTEEGLFASLNKKDHFTNMVEWNQWQQKEAFKILEKDHGNEPIFSDDDLMLAQPDYSGAIKICGSGSLYFYKDKMEFKDDNGKLLIFNFEGINGINVQIQERLEFYYNKELYRFFNKEKRFSALKVKEFYDLSMSL